MNKKLLLATTAFAGLAHLGAANASAAEWNVTVGGFMEQWFGYGDSSLANAEGFDQQSDTEIHFKPTITLDNGIKIGAMVQLDGQTDADQIDQQFAYIEGSFGRVILGSENSAPMLMSLGVPSAGAGLDSGDLPNWIGGVNGDLITTTFNFSRDEGSAQKITYFTPRFYGLQLGASYVPELAEDIDAPPNNINGVRDDAFGFGANYDRSFGDFAFGASGGYMDYGDDDAAVVITLPTMALALASATAGSRLARLIMT
jgi:outer membrane protein OmpU